MSNLKLFILGVSACVAVGVANVLREMRRRCPDCGRRGFRRVLMHHGDYDSTPGHVVRECKSCGMLQVECHRGVERLPRVGWRRAAEEYVLNKPRGFDVITNDATASGDDKGK